jgi:hypothetical protein
MIYLASRDKLFFLLKYFLISFFIKVIIAASSKLLVVPMQIYIKKTVQCQVFIDNYVVVEITSNAEIISCVFSISL